MNCDDLPETGASLIGFGDAALGALPRERCRPPAGEITGRAPRPAAPERFPGPDKTLVRFTHAMVAVTDETSGDQINNPPHLSAQIVKIFALNPELGAGNDRSTAENLLVSQNVRVHC